MAVRIAIEIMRAVCDGDERILCMFNRTRAASRLGPLLALVLTTLLASIGLVVASAPAHAASDAITLDGIKYTVDSDHPEAGATVTDYDPGSNGPHTVEILANVQIGGQSYEVNSIGDEAFYGAPLEEVSIPNTVTTIGESAFSGDLGNPYLTQVTIPDSVITIGPGAFMNTQLEKLTLGDSVTKIGGNAFEGTKLTEVTIPASVTFIGINAFSPARFADQTIEKVTFTGTAPTTFTEGSDPGHASLGDPEGLTVYYPAEYGVDAGNPDGYTTPKWQGYDSEPYQTEYTVTFDTGDGSAVPDAMVDSGDTVSDPGDATWDQHEFTGWYTDADATEEFDFSTPISEDLTLYAGWKLNTHTVTFETGDGSDVSDVTVDSGDTVDQPTDDPTWDEHEFTGWYEESSAVAEFDFDAPITKDVTVYAGWDLNSYIVTFDTGEGSDVSDAYIHSGHIAFPPIDDPVWDEHEFTGWYTDADATEEFDFDTPITDNLTLYAGWKINTYTVTFDTGDGSAVSDITVGSGDTVDQPGDDPTWDEHGFTGWYTDADATEEFDFDAPVTEDITLYAGWERVTVTDPPADDENSDGDMTGASSAKGATGELPATGSTIHPGIALAGVFAILAGAALVLRRGGIHTR